ncbi:ABC transporter substrate-binding protein [Paenibacillus sp. RC67]|uniref:ABC transporter substrate-binding protein n=1 Tax=Paenibacillus sp. RC67 TaxID=3039392 RepID=UPI0024AE25C9|nr:ABC transporter substrate-binding protein [Paenibacillus sp. RC67]
MKKKLSMLLLTSAVVLTASACGNQEPKANDTKTAASSETKNEAAKGIQTSLEGKNVEVEFWHAMTGEQEKALTKITNDFTAKYPNIKVKLVAQGNYGDLQQKLTAAAKAKKSPTLSQTYEDWNTEFIQNDIVTDLTPYINDPKYGWKKEELEDIAKVYRDGNMWDGKYYSLPFNKSTNVLFYNKTLLDKAGVKVPTTWDELKDAAKKLTQDKPDGKGKVIGMGFENSIGMDLHTYVLQAGGTYIDEKNLKLQLTAPEAKDAMNFLYGFIKDGTGRLAGEDKFMSDPFGRGDVAMYVGSSAGITFVDKAIAGKFDWAVAPLVKGKKSAAVIQGTNVSVYRSSSDEQKLAAWEYIKFLINTENTAYWAMQTGYLPVRTSASNLDSYKQFVKEKPNQGVAEKQLADGFFYSRVLGSTAVKNVVMKEVENAFLGKKSIDQALADAEKAGNEEMQKAKAASGK